MPQKWSSIAATNNVANDKRNRRMKTRLNNANTNCNQNHNHNHNQNYNNVNIVQNNNNNHNNNNKRVIDAKEKERLDQRVGENGYRLPDPLPPGAVLIDSTKREWLLGKSIGCGGFGEIYCAKELPEITVDSHCVGANGKLCLSNKSYNGLPKRSCVRDMVIKRIKDIRDKNALECAKNGRNFDYQNYPFVVKVDHICGPLYAEMHFYHRAAKPKQIDNWMLTQRLAFLGMPRYVASGIHVMNGKAGKRQKYRFLVLDRLGLDLQKVLAKQNNKLDLKCAYTIAMMVLDILAYIHSFGYIHADIKASNLLLGRLETESPARELYLVDYGLVERYRTQDGEHKEQEEDQRRANNGTIEFTSRDGHLGALSRRSDLEILAYNLIAWLSGGRLPWIDCKDHEEVRKKKVYYMSHIDLLLKYAFTAKTCVPKGLEEFVRCVARLGFKEDPDYAHLKLIMTRAIVNSGYYSDGLICWGTASKKGVQKGIKRPASSSGPEIGREAKLRKLEKLEFKRLDNCAIPRKTGRTRGVRSAPTTLSRQRTSSISPANDIGVISNPTPQMLEVMKMIKRKSQ